MLEVDTGGVMRRRARKRGHPTKMVGFRCPLELLDAAAQEGEGQTDGLVTILDRGNDAKLELGDEWVEVMVMAHREGITEGQALGRIARMALARYKRK
jgi:hypothetical protein